MPGQRYPLDFFNLIKEVVIFASQTEKFALSELTLYCIDCLFKILALYLLRDFGNDCENLYLVDSTFRFCTASPR